MPHYIILQYPYEHIDIALCRNGKITQSISEHKFNAISLTIPHIQSLLIAQKLTLSDISFICANIGPGPYNTLRAMLTMANGIHFASQIPTIGLCGLDLLASQYKNQNTLVILQAFADNIFYKFSTVTYSETGGCSVNQLIKKINEQPKKFIAIGNGAQKYHDLLKSNTINKLIFPPEIPAFNTIETLAEAAYKKFQENKSNNSYLKPLYFEDLQIR